MIGIARFFITLCTVVIFGTIGAVVFTGCESPKDVKEDITKLREERASLLSEVNFKKKTIRNSKDDIVTLKSELKELKIYKSGKIPKYILKLKLKQSHISLSISKHLKDAANAIEFELPVDKDFYKSLKVGDEIIDEFRSGSFILYGSFGKWKMKVVGKEIRN